MGDFSFCQEVFAKAHRHGLYPDLVINNAGISYIGLLQDMSPEEWDRIVRTNLTSVFNCSKLAIPHMLEQKSGKILNISSVWGNVGASCEVAYSATKGGINSFTRALAKELGYDAGFGAGKYADDVASFAVTEMVKRGMK